jgi:hypothetical protein
VARKLRAGMMPPAGMPRPDPATYQSMSAWLESELDRHATTYTPPPGLHRLNRTEYANSVRDLLDCRSIRRSICRQTTRRPASTTLRVRLASLRRSSRRTSPPLRRSAGSRWARLKIRRS